MKNAFLVLFASLLFTGCSGGGGGGEPAGSGTEVDPNVSGPTASSSVDLYTSDRNVQRGLVKYSAVESSSLSGNGVTIAMFDSGLFENHDEFDALTLLPPSDHYQTNWLTALFSDDIPDLDDFDPEQYKSTYQGPIFDESAHGSHVASLIVGKNMGYAPGASLIMIDNSQENSFIHGGVYNDMLGDVVDAGAQIINVSQTTCIPLIDPDREVQAFLEENTYRLALDKVDAAGAVIVCAAGNQGADLTKELVTKQTNELNSSPFDTPWAKDPNYSDNFVYAVAVNNDGALSSAAGSNYPGDDVDTQNITLSAPGEDVPGAALWFNSFDPAAREGDTFHYVLSSGTSQAAPIVASSLALVLEAFPQLSAAEALRVLLDTANQDFAAFDPTKHGRGIVDLEAALSVDANDYLSAP